MSQLNLIAIHGNGGGAFRFARVLPHAPADVRFHAVTLPGFADAPRDPSLQSMADYARRLRELVQTAVKPGPIVLLGTGIGGSFALELVQRYAHEVDGLILHAPVGTRIDTRLFPRLMKLPGMRTLGQRLFAARWTRPFFKRLLFTHPLPADVVTRFFDEYRQCSVFGQMFDLITADWFASLRPVDLPAALLWGERERVLSVDQLEDYKALLPNHVVRTVPEWDHFPMLEQPEDYARVVVDLARQLVGSKDQAPGTGS